MHALALVPVERQPETMALTVDRAKSFAANSKAEATRRGYASDWRSFEGWGNRTGLSPLPAAPETVALYLADMARKHKPATISRHMAAISARHKACGLDSPASMRHGAVSSVWQGIKRTLGVAQTAKAPVLVEELRAMVGKLRPGVIGIRDRALLLVGFVGAFRRSEVAALDIADIQFAAEGVTVTLRRSKTDQEGEGRKIGIPYGSVLETCPVRSLRAWLDASGIESGPLFRGVTRHGRIQGGRMSGYAVALIVKRCVSAVGLNAAVYGGHSLRAGLATSAAIAGASERSIMNQTGHRELSYGTAIHPGLLVISGEPGSQARTVRVPEIEAA